MLRAHIRLLLTAAVAVGSLFAEQFVGKVVAITDGDTLKVLRSGAEVRVRLHGIDTPERRQPFGSRARRFVGDLAFGKTVTVVVRDHDRYRRLVVEVVLPDGRNLNHELVRCGLAWWYRRYAPADRRLERLENEARRARRGLWSDRSPVAPWEWRAGAKPAPAR
jgi:endonuclease YncB( thermonuclease family)